MRACLGWDGGLRVEPTQAAAIPRLDASGDPGQGHQTQVYQQGLQRPIQHSDE
jgi:hypothetical protein